MFASNTGTCPRTACQSQWRIQETKNGTPGSVTEWRKSVTRGHVMAIVAAQKKNAAKKMSRIRRAPSEGNGGAFTGAGFVSLNFEVVRVKADGDLIRPNPARAHSWEGNA